jgi:hypothetical protein
MSVSLIEPSEHAQQSSADETAWLVEFVRDHDAACPSCDYNLRGLTRARCPECGTELKLSIRLAEPRIGAWIALAAAVTLSAGVGVFLAYLAIRFGVDRLVRPMERWGEVSLCWFFPALLACPIVFFARRRFQRLPRIVQIAAAVTAWLLTVAAFFLFYVGIR